MKVKGKKINFLGDSITEGHGDAPLGAFADRTDDTLDDYRRAFKEVAGYYGLPVLELE